MGISCDTPDANKAFKEKFDFPFDLLCDEDGTVSRAYGAVDSAGAKRPARISYLIGPDGKIAKAYGTVKPKSHPTEVLADLAQVRDA